MPAPIIDSDQMGHPASRISDLNPHQNAYMVCCQFGKSGGSRGWGSWQSLWPLSF